MKQKPNQKQIAQCKGYNQELKRHINKKTKAMLINGIKPRATGFQGETWIYLTRFFSKIHWEETIHDMEQSVLRVVIKAMITTTIILQLK